jgi:uncharacterized protein (TIGR02246 family)
MSDDERAIREVISTWMRTTSAGDSQTVLSLMADDVVFLVPGKPPFGKEVFQAAAVGPPPPFRFDGESNVREVRVIGDWAWCWAELRVVATPLDGGEPTRRSGHTLSIFQRLADGRWVLARDANLLAPEG